MNNGLQISPEKDPSDFLVVFLFEFFTDSTSKKRVQKMYKE
jgi:hypothetical protein